MTFINYSSKRKRCAVINKISNLKFQSVYSLVAFLVFYFIMPIEFNIYEGVRNTVLILAMTVFLKSAPTLMIALNNSSMYSEYERHNKLFIAVMKLLESVMFGLAIVTLLITILAVVGIYASNVLVNTAHLFALTIPMWLTVRGGIMNLIRHYQ